VTPAAAVAANLAVAVVLLAVGVRLIVWGLSGEPGRMNPRRPLWRYLAHRTGLLCSPSLLYMGVPFSTARHRARLTARKDRQQ
jgi:hypothetical protein